MLVAVAVEDGTSMVVMVNMALVEQAEVQMVYLQMMHQVIQQHLIPVAAVEVQVQHEIVITMAVTVDLVWSSLRTRLLMHHWHQSLVD
jgi:hypothetical protein